jgi:hypothetical protein
MPCGSGLLYCSRSTLLTSAEQALGSSPRCHIKTLGRMVFCYEVGVGNQPSRAQTWTGSSAFIIRWTLIHFGSRPISLGNGFYTRHNCTTAVQAISFASPTLPCFLPYAHWLPDTAATTDPCPHPALTTAVQHAEQCNLCVQHLYFCQVTT